MNSKLMLMLKSATISLICLGAIVNLSQTSQASFTSKSANNNLEHSGVLISQTALMSGEFVAAEAPTTGKAKIVDQNGQKYLEIDSAFSTNDQAPDLQILLDTISEAPAKYEGTDSTRYLNLGGIQSVTGAQRYPIPDFVDPSQFQSVVVWCRMANATMGYAPLITDSSASVN
ncbi:MAG TPA: DM13 domain-containing protein [Coleofasciculaceae cyanobacterium]|jgi:hypothetical protein